MFKTIEDCIRALHLVEFRDEVAGVITWHCVPCNVDHEQFQDCNSGR